MSQTTMTPPARKEQAKDIQRFDPFENLSPFGLTFGRLFDDFWSRRWPEEGDRLIAPAIDVTEENDAYTVSTELPGMKKDDIKIQFENGLLTISGEKHVSVDKKESNYHRMERRYGSFYRAVSLPSGVDVSNATADYQNGVLEVRLPKREEAKPKTLKVK
jgi:HSP20 family protein